MKTISKIITCTCVFCYFAGLWVMASRFGLFKLISKYGLTRVIEKIPQDFPQLKYLYIGLAVYTVVYIIVAYLIVRYSERAAQDQEQLQEECAMVVSYTEQMEELRAQYERSDVKDAQTRQKLQTLSRQVASLPPAVARNANMQAEISLLIGHLKDMLTDHSSAEALSAAIDNARDSIDAIKRKSKTVKY